MEQCGAPQSNKKILNHAQDWNYNGSNRSRNKIKIIIWKSSWLLSGLPIAANLDKFSILQSQDLWIANSDLSNDGTAHKRGIMTLTKDESSSGSMGILDDVHKYLCNIPDIFVA